MSLSIIKNDSVKLTVGEDKLFKELKELYKNCEHEVYIYTQPKIGGMFPDFIVIDAHKGISILEVKDWEISYIRGMDKRKVELEDREDDNPVFKTRKYLTILEGLIATLDLYIEDLEYNLYGNAVLTNITRNETILTGMVRLLKNAKINHFTSEKISKLQLTDIFSENNINLSKQDMIAIRTVLFPEIKIQKPTVIEEGSNEEVSIYSLSAEQEEIVRRLPYGPYIVGGVPGSGKSIILIARAIHLVKEHPDWKVTILTFNKSLCTKLESELNRISRDMAKNNFHSDIPVENITVTTFHKLANSLVTVSSDEVRDKTWWDYTLPSTALKTSKPMYNAILIDEYQDFYDDWIRLCIKLCIPHTYKNSENKDVTNVNFFMVGDRLQSINNSKPHNWAKDFDIDLRGRGRILKVSYRSTKHVIALALEFLKKNPTLATEVDKFYDKTEGECINQSDENTIEFLEGSKNAIAHRIEGLIKEGYKYSDILLICRSKTECQQIVDLLPDNIKTNSIFAQEATDKQMRDCLITTTYHSSKGLENKVAIVVGADTFTDQLDKKKEIQERKVLYVGLTRAAEKLIIHAQNFNTNSYAKELKEIYENEILAPAH